MALFHSYVNTSPCSKKKLVHAIINRLSKNAKTLKHLVDNKGLFFHIQYVEIDD